MAQTESTTTTTTMSEETSQKPKLVKLTTVMPWVMGNAGTGRTTTFTSSRKKKYSEYTRIRNGYLATLRDLGVAVPSGDDEELWEIDLSKALSLLYAQDTKSFRSMIGKGHHMETYRSEWPKLTEMDTKKIDQAYRRSLKPKQTRKRKTPASTTDEQSTKTVAVETTGSTAKEAIPAAVRETVDEVVEAVEID